MKEEVGRGGITASGHQWGLCCEQRVLARGGVNLKIFDKSLTRWEIKRLSFLVINTSFIVSARKESYLMFFFKVKSGFSIGARHFQTPNFQTSRCRQHYTKCSTLIPTNVPWSTFTFLPLLSHMFLWTLDKPDNSAVILGLHTLLRGHVDLIFKALQDI